MMLVEEPYSIPHTFKDHDGSLVRYWWYILFGIPDDVVAPIADTWQRNVLHLVATDLSLVSQEQIDASLRSMMAEMNDDYRVCMKRVMMDYVLRNPRERKRVNVLHPPPSRASEWGVNDRVPYPPESWRGPIQSAWVHLDRNLHCINLASVALLQTWQSYQHLTLFALPKEFEFPVSLAAFEDLQKQTISDVRNTLTSRWLRDVEEIYREYSDSRQFDYGTQECQNFFNAVAVLMGVQLREIVRNSAKQFHDFFVKYKSDKEIKVEITMKAPTPPAVTPRKTPRKSKSTTASVQPTPRVDGGAEGVVPPPVDGAAAPPSTDAPPPPPADDPPPPAADAAAFPPPPPAADAVAPPPAADAPPPSADAAAAAGAMEAGVGSLDMAAVTAATEADEDEEEEEAVEEAPVELEKLPVEEPEPPAPFSLRFVLQKAKINFETPLVDLEATVARLFDNMARGLEGLPRVEGKIFELEQVKPIVISLDEGEMLSLKTDVCELFQNSTKGAGNLANLYDSFTYILDEETRCQAFLKQPHTLEEYKKQMDRYRDLAVKITMGAAPVFRSHMILIDCSTINKALATRAEELVDIILKYIAQHNMDKNSALCDEFKFVEDKLLRKPQNSKELLDSTNYLEEFKTTQLQSLFARTRALKDEMNFLFAEKFVVTDDLLTHVQQSFRAANRMYPAMKQSIDLVNTVRQQMEDAFNDRRENFGKLLEKYAAEVKDIKAYAEMRRTTEYIAHIDSLKANLAKADIEVEKIHEQEELLGVSRVEFYALDETKIALEPYEVLWALVAQYKKSMESWLKGPVFSLVSDEVEKNLETMSKSALKFSRELFDASPAAAKMCETMKRDLDDFKPNVPLLAVLCNRGMKVFLLFLCHFFFVFPALEYF
jgi:hypothetical protein